MRNGKGRGFPGGSAVKDPPCGAGDTGSIPGWGTPTPHATEQLSQRLNPGGHAPRRKAAGPRNGPRDGPKALRPMIEGWSERPHG